MNGHIKRNDWVAAALFCLLATALSAYAASFDCAGAGTKVEKLICGDAGLSKLDKELSATYKAALKDGKQADSIKQAQKQWLKETRNTCQDVECLRAAYRNRIGELTIGPNISPEGTPALSAEKAKPQKASHRAANKNGSYTLLMSKDEKLCNSMLVLYNEDMKDYGRIMYDQHQMFTSMWKPVDLDEANHPTYGCLRYWRGTFDINNDGKNELVVKQSACLSGILTDDLSIYPDNSDVLLFNPKTGKLNPLKDTDSELFSRKNNIYLLKDLPNATEIGAEVFFVLNPFIVDGTSYISITDQTPRWIVIAKYKQAEETQDICYFFNSNIKHR